MTDAIKIGHYTVEFDEGGATIASPISRARYRDNEATATNAIDFMKHHRMLYFAVMNNRPEELTAYRIVGAGNRARN